MSGLLDDLEIWNPRGGVMVTVVEAVGSTPREHGTYMIVDPDGRLACGTIGGGALEYEAIARAQAIEASAELVDVPLGPELGQCCGGRVTLLFERLPVTVTGRAETAEPVVVTELTEPIRRRLSDASEIGRGSHSMLVQPAHAPRQPVAVFGAGHVGRAIVRALAPLPFAIRWIDSRADQFPAGEEVSAAIVVTSAPLDQLDALPPGAFALVMTHSHGLDFDLVRRALARGDLGYVGLIGSATKRARFVKRLRAYGVGEAAIGRLTCPIGLPEVTGKDPAVIAASVAADLLVRMSQAKAALRPSEFRPVALQVVS
jgi:xanthine dehydrogenase accessory factor